MIDEMMKYPWMIYIIIGCVILVVIVILLLIFCGNDRVEVSKTDAEYDKIIKEYIKEEKNKNKNINTNEPEEVKTEIVEETKQIEVESVEEIEGEDNMFIKRKKSVATRTVVTTKKAEPTNNKRVLHGKYEVYSENDSYKYVLKASNGEKLVESELYSSKESVYGAIDAVKRNLETGKVSISKDKRDLHQFKLTASNNRNLVVSANYTSKQNAEKALESFKRFALNSPIVEVEAPKDAFGEEIVIEKADLKLNGKLVISAEGKGFIFKLLANNGELLCTSQPYSTKANCEKGVDTLKINVTEGSFFIFKDKSDYYQFKLYSKANRLIAIGQTYEDKQRAISSANSVASFIDDAEIIKE